jgi:hypothetical protein
MRKDQRSRRQFNRLEVSRGAKDWLSLVAGFSQSFDKKMIQRQRDLRKSDRAEVILPSLVNLLLDIPV